MTCNNAVSAKITEEWGYMILWILSYKGHEGEFLQWNDSLKDYAAMQCGEGRMNLLLWPFFEVFPAITI